jgi:hypothetical protein
MLQPRFLVLEYESGPAETKKKNLDAFVISIGLSQRSIQRHAQARQGAFERAV